VEEAGSLSTFAGVRTSPKVYYDHFTLAQRRSCKKYINIFAKNSNPPIIKADDTSPITKYAIIIVVNVAVILQVKLFAILLEMLSAMIFL
jgi:hypothetical protein